MSRGRRLFWWFTALNFAAFAAVSLLIGGDAMSGHRNAGHYFLGSHGHYIEVASALYWYSMVHGAIVTVTIPIAAILGLAARLNMERERKGLS